MYRKSFKTTLFLTTMLTFGSHFCFDAPSVMEKQIQSELGWSATRYHSLFMMNSWSHMIMSLFGGFLIDRFGNGPMAVVFACLFVLGQTMFAYGARDASYWMMLIGRGVFSLGSGPIQIVQNTICARSFYPDGMGLAYGFVLTIGHIGSIANFLVTPLLVEQIGIVGALWIADCLAILSWVCSYVFWWREETGKSDEFHPPLTKIELGNLRKLNLGCFIIFGMTAAYYSIIFPLNSLSSKYFQVERGYSLTEASWIAGITYYVAFVIGPFLGAFVDAYGMRGHLGIIGFSIMIPCILALLFTAVAPVGFMIGLGLSYAIVPSILWGSIPKLLGTNNQNVVGTAMGVNGFFQMVGVGITHLIIGRLKDLFTYTAVFYHLLGLSIVGLLLALILNVYKGRIINVNASHLR